MPPQSRDMPRRSRVRPPIRPDEHRPKPRRTTVGHMLTTPAVATYRSLRDLVLPLSGLTVVTGPNGSGKSSLYRALRLLADASRNGAVAALAREGGLPSTLWAGPENGVRRGTTRV